MELKQVEYTEPVKSFLKRKTYMNLNIIGKIENKENPIIYVDNPKAPTGVLVKEDYFHFLDTDSEHFVEAVVDSFMKDGFYGFAGVDKPLARLIQKKYNLDWKEPSQVYAYVKKDIELKPCSYPCRGLKEEDAVIVDQLYTYQDATSLDNILDDIRKRPSSGIYVEDEPVCWVLTHRDNSVGIMYTKEGYRRQGLAEVVTRDITKKILNLGKIPYLQIVETNGQSPGLAKKCGYEPVGSCEWFGIITGRPPEMINFATKWWNHYRKCTGKSLYTIKDNPLSIWYFSLWGKDYEEKPKIKARQSVFEKDNGILEELGYKEGKIEKIVSWILFEGDKPVGWALSSPAGEEDIYLYKVCAKSQTDFKMAICAVLEAIGKTGTRFVETVIEKENEVIFQDTGFLSFGTFTP